MSVDSSLAYDFKQKNILLSVNFEEVTPSTFYESLYSDLSLFDDTCIVVYGDDTKLSKVNHNPVQKTVRVMTIAEMLECSADYANMYVAPATFFNNINNSKSLKDLYAMVVDFDGDSKGVSVQLLEWLIERITRNEDDLPSPTFITNSGKGLHLFWVFKEPVAMYAQNKKIMKELYHAIHERLLQFNVPPQRHHFAQSYRIVGSKTKLNETTRAFKTGNKISVEDMLSDFGISDKKIITRQMVKLYEDGDEEKLKKIKKPTEAMIKLANNIEKTLGVICEDKESFFYVQKYIKEYREDFTKAFELNQSMRYRKKGDGWGSIQWYQRMKQAIIEQTPEGYRYTSLMAFMVIGYKCNIEFKQVKKDENDIILRWQMRSKPFKERFNEEYKDRVDDMYASKYKKVTKKQLEEWLGFKMNSTSRRNGLSQADHLEEARAIRDIRMKREGRKWDDKNGRKPKKDIVNQWRKDNPSGTPKQCIEATGLSKNTVYKWWSGEELVKLEKVKCHASIMNDNVEKSRIIRSRPVQVSKKSKNSSKSSNDLTRDTQEQLMSNLVQYVFSGKSAEDITDELIQQGNLSIDDRQMILDQVKALLNTFNNLNNLKK